jgi:hypothetical protein
MYIPTPPARPIGATSSAATTSVGSPGSPLTISTRWDAICAAISLVAMGYNGRVGRSHRTDEEFYRPYLLHAKDTDQFHQLALH